MINNHQYGNINFFITILFRSVRFSQEETQMSAAAKLSLWYLTTSYATVRRLILFNILCNHLIWLTSFSNPLQERKSILKFSFPSVFVWLGNAGVQPEGWLKQWELIIPCLCSPLLRWWDPIGWWAPFLKPRTDAAFFHP